MKYVHSRRYSFKQTPPPALDAHAGDARSHPRQQLSTVRVCERRSLRLRRKGKCLSRITEDVCQLLSNKARKALRTPADRDAADEERPEVWWDQGEIDKLSGTKDKTVKVIPL